MSGSATDVASVLKDAHWGLHAHDSTENRDFIVSVYRWMTIGLAITGGVAAYVGNNPALLMLLAANRMVFFLLLGIELLLVIGLVSVVHSLSATSAAILFVLYAFLNGVTTSLIFLIYAKASIASAFFVTAGTFGVMSAYGYFTKTDLTSMGNLCGMALMGLVLASFVNLFFMNAAVLWVTTYLGVFVFVGLTAYDTQKIKQMDLLVAPGSDDERKEAVIGALTLYLDFVNLFLDILRIMGSRKD